MKRCLNFIRYLWQTWFRHFAWQLFCEVLEQQTIVAWAFLMKFSAIHRKRGRYQRKHIADAILEEKLYLCSLFVSPFLCAVTDTYHRAIWNKSRVITYCDLKYYGNGKTSNNNNFWSSKFIVQLGLVIKYNDICLEV